MIYDKPGGWLAELYDGDYAVLRTPSGDVDFYVEQARRCGGPVVEFGCGTGRILVPTVAAGVECIGVDASRDMLERTRGNLERAGLEAQLFPGDMLDIDLGRTFSLVTVPFRPLAHVLEVADQLRLFRNLRRHLAPDGRLIFDHFQFDPKHLASSGQEHLDLEREENGRTVRRFGTTWPHLATQTIDATLRWEIEKSGEIVARREWSFCMRWFCRFEVEHLLARSGLEIEVLYGDFDRAPFDDDSKEMIFVARVAGKGGGQ